MRGAVMYGNTTVEIVDVDEPTPKPGEVVIRVGANGVCGSDLNSFRGQNPHARFPKLFGHEVAGVVQDVGEDVDARWLGKLVAVEPNLCCGTCRYCAAGLPNLCPDYHVLGQTPAIPGGCAEFVAVPASNLYEMPEGTDAVDGALVQPMAICYEAAIRRGGVENGERVLIYGAGPIGLGVQLFAQLAGAEVLIVDLLEARLEAAREIGAKHVRRADDPELESLIMDWTDGFGVDVAFEAVGGKQTQTVRDAQRNTASRGRVVVIGSFSGSENPVNLADLKRREITLLGSSGHPKTFAPVIEHFAAGDIDSTQFVSHRMPLEEIEEVFAMLHEHREGVLKIIVEP